jgi:tetratricopeptide (TPR) repeat protein
MRSAIALDEKSLAESPQAPRQRRDLSTSNTQLGFALRKIGDTQGALAAYHRALDLREGLMRDDANNVQAPRDVATALYYIGVAENDLGRRAEAIATFQRAMPLAVVRSGGTDDLPALIFTALASAYQGSGRLAEALRLRRQALELRLAMLARQPGLKTMRRAVVSGQNEIGGTLAQLAAQNRDRAERRRLWQEARAAYLDGLRVGAALDSAGKLEPDDASIREALREGLARCDRALARPDAAPSAGF